MTAEKADEYDITVPPASPFSIAGGENDEEGALLAAAGAADNKLEGNYSDEDDDDASVDYEEEGHAKTVNLASRTNMLMKDFNEYLTDITGEGSANGNNSNSAAPTPLYRDFVDVEENNVDNNPSTYEDVERELKMQGRFPKQTLRRSKRVKRGIGMIVIAAIIIGVSVSISNSKKNQRLPDWNQELEDQIKQEGITGDGLPGAKPEFSGPMGYEDSYNTFSQTTNTNTNTQPIAEFNTESSSSGNHQTGSSTGNHHVGTGPYNHNVEVTNQPQEHHDNAHQILDGVTHHSSSGSALQQVYLDAQTSYKPIWFDRSTWTGTTYQEAQEFCTSRDPAMEMCPYDAVCPLGPSGHPSGGTKPEAFGSWVPVKNDANTWVQVGPEEPCLLYSYSHGHVPEWGLIKGGNEQQTRHIMCCQIDDTAKDSAVDRNPNLPNSVATNQQQEQLEQQEQNAYYNTEQTNVKPDVAAEEYLAAEEWDPIWYSRSDGWTGQTYEEASNFCKSLGDTSDLCYYSVICPTGPNHLPYGGEIVEASGPWAPIKDSHNGWVQVGSDNVCIRYMTLNLDTPTWGITGEGNEEITRHLPCCTPPNLPTYSPSPPLDDDDVSPEVPVPSNADQVDQPTSVADADAFAIMDSIYAPVLYDRQSGWDGTTYAESIIFCASQESRIPCYYETYCPNGENAVPYGGVSDDPNGAWAPIFDAPNSWVQIGKVGTCQKYNDIHSHPPSWGLGLGSGSDSEKFTRSLLCCKEPIKPEPEPSLVKPLLTDKEETILNNLRPLWFDQSHGYHGTTQEEAELFCNAVIGMHLCPIEAYCPNGPTSDSKPLFLQKETFQGEQWAPFNSLAGTQSDLGNQYVMIGTLDGDPSSTCMPYDSLHTNPLPPWSSDGSKTELKQHVMCCEKPDAMQQEAVISKGVAPIWLDTKHGWGGGSYQDAEQFCSELGGKKLCPYAVYCPRGTGRQPLGGHGADFTSEGLQYAPIFGESNEWVLIGQKDANAATTCMLHSQLESGKPDWGLNEERQDLKNHILCCTF